MSSGNCNFGFTLFNIFKKHIMKNSKVLKVYLFISGALLTFIGLNMAFMAVSFKEGSGIDVVGNINVLNDIRATGVLYMVLGIVMILGVFKQKLTFTASLFSPLIYLAVGTGRVISILQDGTPVDALMKATIVEFVIGAVGVFMFLKYQDKSE